VFFFFFFFAKTPNVPMPMTCPGVRAPRLHGYKQDRIVHQPRRFLLHDSPSGYIQNGLDYAFSAFCPRLPAVGYQIAALFIFCLFSFPVVSHPSYVEFVFLHPIFTNLDSLGSRVACVRFLFPRGGLSPVQSEIRKARYAVAGRSLCTGKPAGRARFGKISFRPKYFLFLLLMSPTIALVEKFIFLPF